MGQLQGDCKKMLNLIILFFHMSNNRISLPNQTSLEIMFFIDQSSEIKQVSEWGEETNVTKRIGEVVLLNLAMWLLTQS